MRYLLTPALALLLLCACKKDEAKPAVAVDALVGTWAYQYVVEAGDTSDRSSDGTRIAFQDGGAFSATRPDNSVLQAGTWRRDGDSLRLTYGGSTSAVRLTLLSRERMIWDAKRRSTGATVRTALTR